MKENRKNQSLKDKSPWSPFTSVKLAITLIFLIAMTSIVGTLLPQQERAIEFARELSPFFQRIWVFMGLSNIFHSWWFRLLIAALAFNLTACTIDRLSSTLRLYRGKLKPDLEKPFEALSGDRTVFASGPPEKAAEIVSDILFKRYSRTSHKESRGVHFFAADKGRFSLFGVHMVHASILLILAGALVGSFFGFQAYVNIPEGSSVDTVYLRGTRAPVPLGFTVGCNDFNVEFYETGHPKEYRSELVFFSEGSEAETRVIRVNHPTVYNGVTFYQSSYGTMPGGSARLKISRVDEPGSGIVMDVSPGTKAPLPGDEAHFHIADMHTSFMGENAAVLVAVHRPGEPEIQFWVMENHADLRSRLPAPMAMSRKFNPAAAEPFNFEFVSMSRRYYTGLQANKDPGVPLVWAGCTLMIAGFIVTFFYSNRRMRVKLVPGKDGVSISATGWSNRNPIGLEQEIDAVLAEVVDRIPAAGDGRPEKSGKNDRKARE